jgi:ribonuclease P protein component
LRRPQEFSAVVRNGRRASTRHLVVHLLPVPGPADPTDRSVPAGSQRPPRAGFVISGKIGNSLVRHRITRRLRPLVRERLVGLPAGTDLVIRALPAAATATSSALASDLDRGLKAVARRSGPVGANR